MLRCLAGVLDEPTIGVLDPLVPKGGVCLELGAGSGTIARWMAERVGPEGRVVVTDLDPVNIPHDVRDHPAVEVQKHDARTGPLPAGPFDVIHARCLWAHLVGRDDRVPMLVESLAPGGSLVIEDWGADPIARIAFSPWDNTQTLFEMYQRALVLMFRAAGNDGSWAGRIHAVMTDAGLIDVQTRVQARSWRGGTAGAGLPIAVSGQVADKLAEHGMPGPELDELRQHLANPHVVVLGNLTWTTVGRRRTEG
jgi:SAM-dependent methyltransferase